MQPQNRAENHNLPCVQVEESRQGPNRVSEFSSNPAGIWVGSCTH